MIHEIKFRPEAETDIEDAASWYESHRLGLGQLFLDEIQKSIDIIANNPLLYPIIYRNTRRVLIHKFPFAIYYQYKENEIIVFGVMHGSRSPRWWKSRT